MRVSVDGQGVEVAAGASVFAAVQAAGRYLPTLCSDPRTSPGGSCRTCLVAIDGSAERTEPANRKHWWPRA
jgi:NADH dehydrogenase/NADH:ubiquinone oxidoreductase subunit G